jgi:O-antigen ligase
MKGLIVTYGLTAAGTAGGLFKPRVGLYVYVLFSIIKPESLWYWSVPQGGNLSRIVAIAMLIGWAARGFGNWRLGKATPVAVGLAAFWAWSILSACFAPDSGRAWFFVESVSKIVVPWLVGITVLETVGQVRLLAWTILVGHAYLALEFNQYYFSGTNYIKDVGFAGMEEGSIAVGMVCASGVALVLGATERSWWLKAVAFLSLGLIIHVVCFSFSRGGMLGLFVAMGVAFALMPKHPRTWAVMLAVALVVLRLMGPQVRDRFATAFAGQEHRDASAQSRLDLWSNCWDTMLDHPVLGVGPYHFPLIVHTFGWQRGKEAHTLWLQIGAELGFPGLLFLLTFYGSCVVRLWPLAAGGGVPADPLVPGLARVVIASLLGFAVAGQFISLWALEAPYYVALVGAGVLKLTSGPDAAWAGGLHAGQPATAAAHADAGCLAAL